MEGQLAAQRLVCSTLALLCACVPLAARADDAGPRRDVADVRYAAARLLAHRLRGAGIEPKTVLVSDVVVVKNEALLTWSAGGADGIMGMSRYLDRWWDDFDENARGCPNAHSAFPLSPSYVQDLDAPADLRALGFSSDLLSAAQAHNSALAAVRTVCHDATYDVFQRAIDPRGKRLFRLPAETSGYDFALKYSANNAPYGAKFTSLRVRSPSAGEIITYPSPPHGSSGSTGVLYYYLDLASSAPVTFGARSTIDVWVPFVLDDSLRYELNLFEPPLTVGPVRGTIFDNVLHFELPALTARPGELSGEIDAFW